MLDQSFLKELSEKFIRSLPESIKKNLNFKPFREETAKTFKLVLEQAFNKLDLVTREQFDIQANVLADTRDQLEKLIKKVKKLEKELKLK